MGQVIGCSGKDAAAPPACAPPACAPPCGAKKKNACVDRSLALWEDNDTSYIPGITGVHMLVCALDYPGTSAPLTCTRDGKNILDLARKSEISDITYMTNSECTRDGVLDAITEVGNKCAEGEYFIFFYAGHGANIPDDNGDESDGQDEALCTVTLFGDIDFNEFIRDDEFAQCVTNACVKGTKILIMCDCCHSGTVGDLDQPCWDGHKALSMSGCNDDQTSGDTGKGGIWTHSMMLAVQAQQGNARDYSCAQLYNTQLEWDDKIFNSEQDIKMYWTDTLGGPENMSWPLVPQMPYRAPWYTSRDLRFRDLQKKTSTSQ